MKKVLFVLLDLLSAAFLAGGYVIQYFTKRKLGMVRWVNYHEMKIREAMPIDVLKYVAVIAALILAVMIVVNYMKKRAGMGKLDAVMMMALVILSVGYLVATVLMNSEVTRSWYLILPLIGASTLMQIVRNGIAVWTYRDEK